MQAQAYAVCEESVVESGRQGRLNQIRAEMVASWEAMGKAQDAARYARADFKAAQKRLERARKDLAGFVECNFDMIVVK